MTDEARGILLGLLIAVALLGVIAVVVVFIVIATIRRMTSGRFERHHGALQFQGELRSPFRERLEGESERLRGTRALEELKAGESRNGWQASVGDWHRPPDFQEPVKETNGAAEIPDLEDPS